MDHGLLRSTDPHVSARAVIGATERLLQAHFRGEPIGAPAHAGRTLVQLVLQGLGRGD